MQATEEKKRTRREVDAECKELRQRIEAVLGIGEEVRIYSKDGIYTLHLRSETTVAGIDLNDIMSSLHSKLYRKTVDVYGSQFRPLT